MLAEATEYSGGELHLYIPNRIEDAFDRNGTMKDVVSSGLSSVPGTAYIFPSHEVHRVTNITSGQRKVLVLEFWAYEVSCIIDLILSLNISPSR